MSGIIERAVTEVREQGFTLIPDVIDPAECDRLKAILEATHRKYAPHYVGNPKSPHRLNVHTDEKIVYNLHNKDRAFLKFIDLPPVFDIVETLLKEGSYRNADPVILRQNTARTPLKGKPIQQLHLDSRLPGCPFPLMGIVIWFLDDATPENGATRVIPGSHRRTTYPKDGVVYPEEVQVPANKGSAIVIDGGVWHASGENHTESTRWVILSTYVRWFFKPAFDFNRNMPREFYETLSERQKRVMGYCCNPPLDEFTRLGARSENPDTPAPYSLPRT
jgi:ectoine hydroxylase-related dioxygenase (phytanoyl-CoA dioxygenase family)